MIYNILHLKKIFMKKNTPIVPNQESKNDQHQGSHTTENVITHLHLSEFFDLLVEFSALPSILSHLLFLYQL